MSRMFPCLLHTACWDTLQPPESLNRSNRVKKRTNKLWSSIITQWTNFYTNAAHSAQWEITEFRLSLSLVCDFCQLAAYSWYECNEYAEDSDFKIKTQKKRCMFREGASGCHCTLCACRSTSVSIGFKFRSSFWNKNFGLFSRETRRQINHSLCLWGTCTKRTWMKKKNWEMMRILNHHTNCRCWTSEEVLFQIALMTVTFPL